MAEEEHAEPEQSLAARIEHEQAERNRAEEIIDFLKLKWGDDARCPYCGDSKWQVGGHMEIPMLEGTVLPVVPVMCGNCANTTLVNILALRAQSDAPVGTGEGEPE
jgi:hypothetical protein